MQVRRFTTEWVAVGEDNETIGVAHAWDRPDGRTFLKLAGDVVRSVGPLATAAVADLGRPVSVILDYDDIAVMRASTASGFRIDLVSEGFRVPFLPALDVLQRAKVPSGFALASAADVDPDRLFDIDNTVRNLVQGMDGWRGDRARFDEEMAESPPFDAAAYLVAIHADSGTWAGLVRVWRNPTGPRLGLVAVLPAFRSTTIGAILFRDALRAASTWGHDSFVTETSLENAILHHRLIRYGATSTGRFARLTLEAPR